MTLEKTSITEDLIYSCEPLIYSIINKYTFFFDRDYLYQVATIGLIHAYNHYKENKNTKFSSYAYFYIIGEVKKYIRESNFFKVSKDLSKIGKRIEDVKVLLTNKFGKIPTNYEIASFLKIDIEKIEEAINANMLLKSLDYMDEEEISMHEKVGFIEQGYNEEILDLKEELKHLSSPEKRLIKERYENGHTQNETSKILGISQVQVSRKEKEILTRLRARLQ